MNDVTVFISDEKHIEVESSNFGFTRSASSVLSGCEAWRSVPNATDYTDSADCHAWCANVAEVGQWIQITGRNNEEWTHI